MVSRPDVGRYVNRVRWYADEAAMLESADGVVIAKPPSEQVQLAKECLMRSNIKKILLEKPLATTPQDSLQLIDALEASGKTFRIGYNFRFTDWGKLLLQTRPLEIDIDWQFRAYHYTHNLQNWKRANKEGGGALRFFGIHLIALFAELGFNEVQESQVWQKSPGDVYCWKATMTQKGVRRATVNVNSDSNTANFSITDVAYLKDPFDAKAPTAIDQIDYRASVVGELCQDLIAGKPAFYPWYRDSIDLWAKIEQQTQYDQNDQRRNAVL